MFTALILQDIFTLKFNLLVKSPTLKMSSDNSDACFSRCLHVLWGTYLLSLAHSLSCHLSPTERWSLAERPPHAIKKALIEFSTHTHTHSCQLKGLEELCKQSNCVCVCVCSNLHFTHVNVLLRCSSGGFAEYIIWLSESDFRRDEFCVWQVWLVSMTLLAPMYTMWLQEASFFID